MVSVVVVAVVVVVVAVLRYSVFFSFSFHFLPSFLLSLFHLPMSLQTTSRGKRASLYPRTTLRKASTDS